MALDIHQKSLSSGQAVRVQRMVLFDHDLLRTLLPVLLSTLRS